MGCGCGRQYINKKNTKKKYSRRNRISMKVLDYRRDVCSECDWSTKRKSNKISSFGALGPTSKCLKSNRILQKTLKDPKYSCPINKFPSVKSLNEKKNEKK